ncbi:Claspin like protein [Melipona quadrifasciata]|uniref:Claspin like protein n=1 Tax=Melipona quadrifasciata TaxID=166423 RepID=A0A0M9A367_9HYME|nr:Claspin like protein [Melipona quadrifasciata]
MYENNNSSNVCNDKSDVQYGCKESELADGLRNFVGQESKCSEMKNYSDTEKENILNKTSKEIDNELDQENNECKNETNASENNACGILNESIKEKDCESEQNDDKAKSQIDNNSNSDTDIINKSIKEKDISDQRDDKLKNNNIHNRLFRIIDSDSEEEHLFTPKFKKMMKFVDDEKDEMSNSELDDVSSKNLNKSRTMKLVDSDSDDTSSIVHASDAKRTISNEKEVTNSIRSKLHTLIDSESDEEKRESDGEREESDEEQPNPKIQNKNKKKNSKPKEKLRKVSLRASKEEAMKQIHSETQRLIRETEISLPYHNPKQRTIQEFLKRRKVISSFPVPTVASKLKEFSSIVDEILKEKEKEAEIFYKSSDSEEEIIENRIITNELDEDDEFPPLDYLDSLDTAKKNVQNIESLKPKLRGIPGQVIDLTDDITSTKQGIDGLIDRFVRKHSKSDGPTKSVSKVTTTQIKETRNGGLSIIKETLPYRLPYIENIDPKLEKPGAKLMRLKEELKRRMAIKRNEEWKQREQEMKEQEIEWNESINEEDNFNEPYSPNIEPHISEEDEVEEDDVYMKVEKKRKKKNAFIEDEAEVSEDEINDSDDSDDIEDEDEDEDERKVQESLEEDEKSKRRVSSNEDENSSCDSNDTPRKCQTFRRIVKPLDDDSRSSINENDKNNTPISKVHVESNSKWQMNQTPQSKSNNLDFISPITQLTALNVQLEEEETTEDALSLVDPILREFTKTPESAQIKRGISQKKLFDDHSAVLDEELMEISSGKFRENKMQLNLVKESNVTESQLLELCSGTFNSQPNNVKESVNITGGILQSIQVLDEKDSSNTEINKKDRQQSKGETTFWNKLRVFSALSSNDEAEEDDEKFIDYDSEENEVIVPKKEIKQYAAKFLEEEAELSESDCDVSADEDEQDLDKLELEDGDNEEIDETKVKNQLGKLHMKQILDEDKREVRMLQEMLFEEGDLFSESTRERKFRWRNIDKQGDNTDVQPSEDKDGWVDVSDDEDEEKWRKIRLERESFLAEKVTNIDTEIEDELKNSHIFKFGLKILKKRRINELQKENTLAEKLDDFKTEPKISHTVAEMLNTSKLDETSRTIRNVMKKRSFLAKGEEALTRLATLARRKETPLSSINTKNFIFTHIDDSKKVVYPPSRFTLLLHLLLLQSLLGIFLYACFADTRERRRSPVERTPLYGGEGDITFISQTADGAVSVYTSTRQNSSGVVASVADSGGRRLEIGCPIGSKGKFSSRAEHSNIPDTPLASFCQTALSRQASRQCVRIHLEGEKIFENHSEGTPSVSNRPLRVPWKPPPTPSTPKTEDLVVDTKKEHQRTLDDGQKESESTRYRRNSDESGSLVVDDFDALPRSSSVHSHSSYELLSKKEPPTIQESTVKACNTLVMEDATKLIPFGATSNEIASNYYTHNQKLLLTSPSQLQSVQGYHQQLLLTPQHHLQGMQHAPMTPPSTPSPPQCPRRKVRDEDSSPASTASNNGASNSSRSGSSEKVLQRPKKKHARRLKFDEDTSSPVSGTVILGPDEAVVTGDIDPAFNIVEVTEEARAELAKIENRLGPYQCKLCRQLHDDAFQLAQHREKLLRERTNILSSSFEPVRCLLDCKFSWDYGKFDTCSYK